MARSWLYAFPVLATFASGVFACGAADEAEVSDDNLTTEKASIEKTISSPIPELSGLALRKTTSGVELLGVGDRDGTLVVGSATGSSLKKLETRVSGTPQWESIASDASGRIFVLGEQSGVMTVYEKDASAIKHTMTIELPAAWRSGNAGGEGFLLLKNGHMLVVKEKDPVQIVEVGPKGDAAKGYQKGFGIRPGDTFKLPTSATSKRVVLKTWSLGDNTGAVAKDVSDIAVSPAGDLYLLTDQGRAILQMQATVTPEEGKIKAIKVWELPRDVAKPEGLVFLDDGRPIVCSDVTSPGSQIFLLKKLK